MNRFQIISKLSEGGFGEVFRAWDLMDKRPSGTEDCPCRNMLGKQRV